MTETLGTMLTNIGSFFTQAITWVGEALDVVVSNPALFVMVIAIPVAGVAIGYLSRLFRLG